MFTVYMFISIWIQRAHTCAHTFMLCTNPYVKQDLDASDTLNSTFLRSPTSVKKISYILVLHFLNCCSRVLPNAPIHLRPQKSPYSWCIKANNRSFTWLSVLGISTVPRLPFDEGRGRIWSPRGDLFVTRHLEGFFAACKYGFIQI